MPSREDCAHPDFWSSRYASGRMPWDLGAAPRALLDFLRASPARGAVLIPGCGSGYEVRAFREAGWDATAIDFSPVAVDRARGMLGALGDRVICGDFFAHDLGDLRFELIYERTFLCSLPPARWPDYAGRVADLLAAGGRLVGIFCYGREDDPPPYPLDDEAAARALGSRLRLVRSEPVADSPQLFAGMERWQEWEKAETTRARVRTTPPPPD